MKIKNISSKIINIAGEAILPDGLKTLTKAQSELPAIKAFKKMGLVEFIETTKEDKDSKKDKTKNGEEKESKKEAEVKEETPAN